MMHFRSMVAITALLAGVSTAALAASRPSAIPSHPALNHLMLFPHADLILLLELLENPDENAERLLASDDPADIGLGIFVASYSSDLDRLLAARDLLFDDRETLPTGSFMIDARDPRRMFTNSRTVGQHLARTYVVLFGLDDGRLTKVTDIHAEVARIAQKGNAWEYASAWRHRYLVAMTEDDRKFILNEIRNLPDVDPSFYFGISERWAKLPSAARSGVVDEIIATPNETLRLFVARDVSQWGFGGDRTGHCDRILNSLSPETRHALQTRSLEYPPDQVIQRIHHSDYGGGIYGWYESVTRRAE